MGILVHRRFIDDWKTSRGMWHLMASSGADEHHPTIVSAHGRVLFYPGFHWLRECGQAELLFVFKYLSLLGL